MKINVTKSSMPSFDEYCTEIKDLWDSRWLTNMGKKHTQLSNQLKAYLDIENIELLSSGHMALELSLASLNLTGEVITTPFSFASTTHAIVRNGLTPVFCDIDPDTYTIDSDKIESLITDKTSAILPVHVYGNVCDIEALEKLANKYNLKIIYDAAHCFGVKYKGKSIASYGDVSCFSFHATKVFHTIEGGAACFKESHFCEALSKMKDFGIQDSEHIAYIGPNAKMSEFHAAMGICNLRHIEEEIRKRKLVYERYMEHFENIPGIQTNKIQSQVDSNYAYFPIVINPIDFGNSRDFVFNRLTEQNINARKYFYPLISDFNCYKITFNSSATPIAQYVSNNVLSLPMYSDLEPKDIDLIANIVLSCQNNKFLL